MEEIPKTELAKFFGVSNHELQQIAQSEAQIQAAIAYYNKTGWDAAHEQQMKKKANGKDHGQITLPFEEARKLAAKKE